ncbi:hypothetical protein MBLNU457_3955t1 [Dothideomycetes sp. NU457]
MALVPKMPKEAFKQQKMLSHGMEIFAYNNIHTNQVVYSLDRALRNNDAIKQLTYAGKGSVPTTLRKDMWRPLWMASFPSTAQGLAAYKMLREWRRLHELSWDPSDLPAREFKDAAEKKQYDDRREELEKLGGPGVAGQRKGGARGKERIFSIERGLSRLTHNKAAKKKIIQDQKANSVADLAAVLLEQDNMREKSKVKREEMEKEYKEKLWIEVQDLYEEMTTQDGLVMVEADLAAAGRNLESVAPTQTEDASRRRTRGLLKREIKQLRQRRDKFKAITKILEAADIQAAQQAKDALKQVQDQASAANRELTEDEIKGANSLAELDKKAVLRLNLSKLAEDSVFGELHGLFKKATGPLQFDYTSEGVLVRWSNFADRDFAAEWPRAVDHDDLGLSRHTMPNPADPPLMQIEDKIVYEHDGDKRRELNEYEAWQYLTQKKAEEYGAPGEFAQEQPVYVESSKARRKREMKEQMKERRVARAKLAEEHQGFLVRESAAQREEREQRQEAAVKELPFKQRVDENMRENAKYDVFSEYFETWRRSEDFRQWQEEARQNTKELE